MLEFIGKDCREKLERYLQNRKLELKSETLKDVTDIIEEVRDEGDKALFSLTKKYDGADLNELGVDEDFLKNAAVKDNLLTSLKNARDRLLKFYEHRKPDSWVHPGLSGEVGENIHPIQRVGLYVPGGRAAYPSSALMTAIPAQAAGVEEIAAVTPPDESGSINPITARALDLCGVDEVYKIGGAQAIAALALGTETIPAVDKIVGPGNKYVTAAKKLVYGFVDIDMLAGPSEVLIIADSSAEPALIAADLLAQAEHDPEARAVVVSNTVNIYEDIERELIEQLDKIETSARAEEALKNHGAFFAVENLNQAVELANRFAPEHLEVMTSNPAALEGHLKNAGSLFLGSWTPEAAGDYIAGPSHVLPTSGTASFFSPLSVNEFTRSCGRMNFNSSELIDLSQDIMRIAIAEGLPAHARSVELRQKIFRE